MRRRPRPVRPECFKLARQMAVVLLEEGGANQRDSFVATLKLLVDIILASQDPIDTARFVARVLPGLVRTEREQMHTRVLTPNRERVVH
jgi:hypothetical protein